MGFFANRTGDRDGTGQGTGTGQDRGQGRDRTGDKDGTGTGQGQDRDRTGDRDGTGHSYDTAMSEVRSEKPKLLVGLRFSTFSKRRISNFKI